MRGSTMASLLASLALLAGCASSGIVANESSAPLARQVTQSSHCGLTGPGLAYVQTEDRLQQLLHLPAQNMAVQQLRAVDLEQEHLLFVTLGERPTGGYSVGLVSAAAEEAGKTLSLSMAVRTPAPGTMVTQALTSPCVVVAFPARDWSEIRVSGVGEGDLRIRP
ncbi:protease complex subunit PrcB family protein [Marinobacter aromaticivorans]|uniref:Protease complex subunit PrcB family protein n=1 Tax=Marinobacter aromaticivorans TaxID=1494078 RepID=A0ABW2ISH9_9GAMM|nr:protease complex subunit PrcB family protein [Marinobacter aromaticivorans]